jgi:POT family proton-dependent oligopeptide transporter
MNATALVAPATIKHPKEVYRISLVMACLYFSYYGTTALLIVYIVQQLHFNEHAGYGIFGTFAALVWGLPLFCGVVADRLLGSRRSMIWGCVLNVIGSACLIFPTPGIFFLGLSFIAAGNGFFAGIYKTLAGSFYTADDHKGKDAGFTIVYGLFNVGIGIGALLCGYIGQEINWQLGFAVAGLGSLCGLISLVVGIGKQHGLPPDVQKLKRKPLPFINMEILVYVLTLPAVGLLWLLFQHTAIMDALLLPLVGCAFIYIIYTSFKFTKTERWKIFAALVAFVSYVLFLALYEQSGGSFNLFVVHNMDMRVGSITLPGLAINNFLPGFLPAIMMPLMLYSWRRLSAINREPGTIMKFIIGFLFMAAFFGSFWWGCKLYSNTGLVPVYFLFGGYILMEFSELCVGPIMYSVANKLAPQPIASTMMGVLGISASLGEYLASKIGSLASVPDNIKDPVKSLPYYTKIYGELALLSVGVAVIFTLLLPLLKRLMQDVK